MREISGRDLRNALAILQDISRSKVEEMSGPVSDRQWQKFCSNPARGFLSGDDKFQGAVTMIVNQRLEEC